MGAAAAPASGEGSPRKGRRRRAGPWRRALPAAISGAPGAGGFPGGAGEPAARPAATRSRRGGSTLLPSAGTRSGSRGPQRAPQPARRRAGGRWERGGGGRGSCSRAHAPTRSCTGRRRLGPCAVGSAAAPLGGTPAAPTPPRARPLLPRGRAADSAAASHTAFKKRRIGGARPQDPSSRGAPHPSPRLPPAPAPPPPRPGARLPAPPTVSRRAGREPLLTARGGSRAEAAARDLQSPGIPSR